MQQTNTFTNDEGRTFAVRIVLPGERYGRDDCLVHDGDGKRREPMVEFYDFTYAGDDFGPHGQFISRYYLSTLTEDATILCRNGLDLDGGIPAWKLDGPTFRDALIWVIATVPWQALSEPVSGAISEAISERKSEPKLSLQIRLVFRRDEDGYLSSNLGEYHYDLPPLRPYGKPEREVPGWAIIDRKVRGDWQEGSREARFYVGPWQNYQGTKMPKARKYIGQDYARMEAHNNGEWDYVGLQAEAIVGDNVVVTSGGLWGVEDDSGDEYFDQILAEEVQDEDFRAPLYKLGFTDDDINEARDHAERIEVGR